MRQDHSPDPANPGQYITFEIEKEPELADIKATLTSKTDEWETPPWLLWALTCEFDGIDLDPCCTDDNSTGKQHYTKETNGLIMPWKGFTYCNPPYSEVAVWAEKAFQEAFAGNATVGFLCAARTDTRWWWKWARQGEVRFIPGRIQFYYEGKPTKVSAPFPSALIVFRKNIQRYTPTTVYWDVDKTWRENE